jgi:redox-sensitive bicupin YhaK (pirin superfamily)
MVMRQVSRVVRATPTSDGAGVRLSRSLGGPFLPQLDPFLLLDEIGSDDPGDYRGGFPDHPHRGFETVTYLLAGKMEHRDSMGNHGLLEAGDVQWMTAGRGIVHSEMPRQDRGRLWGFQLWVNLPRARKMDPPRYQDLRASEVPEVEVGGARVRVIAGTFGDVTGAVNGVATAPTMLDVTTTAASTVALPAPADQTAFAYVFDGDVRLGDIVVPRQSLAVLGDGDGVEVTGDARFLLLAATPLNEPVARYGPFVMSTREELLRAFEDYQSGRLVAG